MNDNNQIDPTRVNSPTGSSWKWMRQRCMNPKNTRYKDYGGRGIRVCERWAHFSNFLADMGVRPLGMQLDRIKNEGNYEPENCRWATRSEQQNNTRYNVNLTHQGKTQTLTQWVTELGINYSTARNRLRRGWSVEDALRVELNVHREVIRGREQRKY